MKMLAVLALAASALAAASATDASAAACAKGEYRAGCIGPRGAVVAKRPGYMHRGVTVRRTTRPGSMTTTMRRY